jgi:signal transduction histidine kinase/putative methionine-R-sulfoxide reductase with GAF domain/CheY-like chemotaxis protein
LKVIGSRKSLFAKTAVIGFVITSISFALFYVNHLSSTQEIDRVVRIETEAYFSSIQQMADLMAGDITKDAATLLKSQLDKKPDIKQALLSVKKDIAEKGINDAFAIYIDQDGKPNSNPDALDSEYINEYHRLYKSGRDKGYITFQNHVYSISLCPVLEDEIGDRRMLIIVLPLDKLYAIVDHDRRLRSPVISSDKLALATSSNSALMMPITTFDGKRAGYLGVQPRAGTSNKSSISNWEIIGLGLLPLFGFTLFILMLYRYFESFANHSAILRKILKREKQGIELFRRDQEIVKNNMPELSEIFELVDESLNEKVQLKKTLDMIAATLTAIREKGHDTAGISDVIEFIVKSTESSTGALLVLNAAENRVEIIGKYNLSSELFNGLSQTPMGLNFLKYAQKQETGLHISNYDLPDEPWQKLFETSPFIVGIPLVRKSQFEGLLVLISQEPNPYLQASGYFTNLIGELMADLIYVIGVERDKQSRYDKTKILQETSLAISSKLDLPSVLQVFASHLTDYAEATYCLILLNTDFEGIMEVATFHSRRQQGVSIPELARINIADLPNVAEAMESKRTLIFGVQEHADLSGMERRFFRTESIKLLTILPISHSAKSIGAVILGEERAKPRTAISPDKLSFVQAIVSQAASAIENARLYGFINNKVDQMTTLYGVSAVLQSESNINVMLDKVLIAIREYLHFTAAAIYIIDDKSHNLRPLVVNALDSKQVTDKLAFGTVKTVSEKVALSGDSLIIEDFRVETDTRPSFPRLLSEMAVPVKSGNRTTGVLTVGSQSKCAFGEMHENFLKALSAQIALAMERSRLFEQERERGLKLNTIFEFSKKLSKSLNVQEVIKIAADSIRDAFRYQLVAIFLLDQVNRRYYTGYQASLSDKKLPSDFTIDEGCGLVGAAIKSRKTIYCPDVLSEPDYVLGIDAVKSEVCIPILVGDKILGVLDVESMEFDGFTAEDKSTLEALADIMAVAIDNSYLFEESIKKAERLSLIDNINKAISATLDLDSFFRVVARAVADNAGYRWASLVVPEGDSFIFKAGYTPKSVGIISTEATLDMLAGRLKSVIESGIPEFVPFSQLASLGVPEKLQSVVDAGIRNLALFPIGDETRTEAIMIVGSAHSDDFSSQELQLLKDLAVHLRIAWQNAQLYKELKTAYNQLQDAQERIVQTEKLRALGEMSSGVVHDFNNILAAILGRLQIISKRLDNYEDWSGREFLQNNLDLIEKAANDGSHILSRISEFTKKKPSEKFVEVHLDQIIADTVELTRPRWHDQALAKGKSIDMVFHHDGDLLTTGSPSELREVFINLINNAVDAINGDARITIDAGISSNNEILIAIEDTGIGMSAETRKKIFEPFFTTKGDGGTGLGLSVTYGIITRHKGTINVESELGRGTKFTILLPIRKLGQDPTTALKIKFQEHKPCTILVVDDEEGFRELLIEILASGGHEADSAPGVDAALEMINSKNYDLVITDLGMSGKSGWELADGIFHDHPEIKVIMATGWGANIDSENLRLHHVASIIGKPFKVEEILSVVDEVSSRPLNEVLVDQN